MLSEHAYKTTVKKGNSDKPKLSSGGSINGDRNTGRLRSNE